ncbi:myb-like protein X isoform X2 [Montipora foliosa]|uniref:myb-like protein X isoform X2 n=1 Tax=Montipora foliosa TaxID=591990 RepID=UPI0035F19CE6
MSIPRTDDSDASERELLVDDIQRIREVLHTSSCAGKISSDDDEEEEEEEEDEEGEGEEEEEEEDEEVEEDEEEEEEEEEEGEEEEEEGEEEEEEEEGEEEEDGSEGDEDELEKQGENLTDFHSNSFQSQQLSDQAPLSHNGVVTRVCRVEESERVPVVNPTQVAPVSPFLNQINENFVQPADTGNVNSYEYTFTELKAGPVNDQSSASILSTSVPSTSFSSTADGTINVPSVTPPSTLPSTIITATGYSDGPWLEGTNQCLDERFSGHQEDEEGELFLEGDEGNEDVSERHREIQQCLSLNRDYQLAVLDELEGIELALAKNREKQFGLHQMRASKDEGKPEPHTLIKFGNPYFRDSRGVGPPDNVDTKMNRQSCHVGGYQSKQKVWNDKEKQCLTEGVRMQNLENKLCPVLQKIRNLKAKTETTETDLKELETLRKESSRIKSLPKETLLYDLEGIDWDKLSSTYVPKRTAIQCRLQWCNFGHPDVNRTPWTKEEDKKLLQLTKDPQNNWITIAQSLQTKRTPIHCYERYQRSLNKNLLKSKWTPEDDKQLLEVVRIVGLGNWRRVASFLEGRQGDQCLHRYTQTLQMVRKGKWTPDEDELLKKGIEKFGTCWNKVSEEVPGRSGPQCRERWVNALDPKVDKGPWTPQQDRKLLENIEIFGKGNWSKIARALGNRTDNQCWRRWIVLCKDDFLYYRQNTLRKKREMVANFTGRKHERPALEPEDLDIPDVPVVRGRPGRNPLPPEVSRERRKITKEKFKEKKRAEKRRAEEEARERSESMRERRQVQYAETEENEEDVPESATDDNRGSSEALEGHKSPRKSEAGEENASSRKRKAGNNRKRIQQPHHRVLMKKKVGKGKRACKERQAETQSEATAGVKSVPVSGSLGPFSLLLQAFSIDIPTVLRAIQNTSATPSTLPPTSVTNVSSVTANTSPAASSTIPPSSVENVSSATSQTVAGSQSTSEKSPTIPSSAANASSTTESSNEQHTQTKGGQEYQRNKQIQKETSGVSTAAQPSSHFDVHVHAGVGDVTRDSETRRDGEQTLMPSSSKSGLLRAKGSETDLNKSNKVAGLQQKDSINNSETSNLAQVDSGSGSSRANSASSTNQTTQKRAPAIPPLPPCYTTLRTFKSLLLLRPQLQRVASMLNPAIGVSAMSPQMCQASTAGYPEAPSGSNSNSLPNVSQVTNASRDESRNRCSDQDKEQNGNVLLRNEALYNTRNATSCEDHGVFSEFASDEQLVKEPSATNEHVIKNSGSVIGGVGTKQSHGEVVSGSGQPKTTSFNSQLNQDGVHSPTANNDTLSGRAQSSETTSPNTSPCQQEAQQMKDKAEPEKEKSSVAITTRSDSGMHVALDSTARISTTIKERIDITSVSIPATENKRSSVATGNRLYRNSYEYKMLSSRFSSLFLWPALLSKIPVRFTSQIRPVFVQRHPPPNSSENVGASRKRPRLAKNPVEPAAKRKQPGLAAVRMASSTSFTTPAQQMCTVGQSSAIRREANSDRARTEASGANEVAIAASQLVSLQSITRSLPVPSSTRKRPISANTGKRKTVPVKRRKTTSSESSSPSPDDDSDDLDFVIDEEETIEPPVIRNTRQTHGRIQSVSANTTSCVQGTSDTTAELSSSGANKTVATSEVIVISSDSVSDSLPSSLQKKRNDVEGRHSVTVSDHSPNESSPSSSAKRKNLRPERNRGARWRSMLPKTSSDDSDVE